MEELVSVVISIYRPDRDFLLKQLRSINNQTYANIEIVVLNDCPEEEIELEFLEAALSNYPVRYYVNERNFGYTKSFERLVSLAAGRYIAFCDQDDEWLPRRIEQSVENLEQNVLVVCDRGVIDAEDNIVVQSWKKAHPSDPEVNWKDGTRFTAKAAFRCYGIGMATMVQADFAKQCLPFPEVTGHDKWLALCANEYGTCAFIDDTLVMYRRHGDNVSGILSDINCKNDWYENRLACDAEIVREFEKRFPQSEALAEMKSFIEARRKRSVFGMLKYRDLEPQKTLVEIGLKFLPNALFVFMLQFIKRYVK